MHVEEQSFRSLFYPSRLPCNSVTFHQHTVALILNFLTTMHDHHTHQPSLILITKVREDPMHERGKLGVYGNLNISRQKAVLYVVYLIFVITYLYLFYISVRKIIKLKNLVKLTDCPFPLFTPHPLDLFARPPFHPPSRPPHISNSQVHVCSLHTTTAFPNFLIKSNCFVAIRNRINFY